LFHPNSNLQKAISLHQAGRLAEAEVEYKAIIIADGGNPDLYLNLLDALSRQGKNEDALTQVKKGIKKFPNVAQLEIAQSQLLINLNLFDDARDLSFGLVKKYPKIGAVHYNMGNVHMHAGYEGKALESFKRAVEFHPNLAEAHYNIGVLYYRKGNLKMAEQKWIETLKYNPNLISALINLGNIKLDQTLYKEAIVYFEKVLVLEPQNMVTNKMIGMAKHMSGKIEDALKHYEILLKQSHSEEALTLVANANRDLGNAEEAEKLYREVIKINPNNQIAIQNLGNIDSTKIDVWHLDMLADIQRNSGFYEAIKRIVKNGDTVLDIGTGTGLLSMMCAKTGASQVYGCEMLEEVAVSARNVINDNGFEDKIEVIHKKSTKVEIGKELNEKVDVIVSEIVDAGLLGEGVIPSVRHAKNNLLKDGGKILPQAATIMGALVESEHLNAINELHNVCGFDLSKFGKFDKGGIYHSTFLRNVPHKILTNSFKILDIDFYNLPKIASPENPNQSQIEVSIIENGMPHLLVYWFELLLDDQLSLSSGPDGEMIHWGQATYGLPNMNAKKKGDKLKFKVNQSEMQIDFELIKN